MAGNHPLKVGILALQGAVEPHRKKLEHLGAQVVDVRYPHQLEEISGIILPGGESTTMIHLLKLNQLWEPLKNFARTHTTWGVCAGSILLAKEVANPAQESLGLLDIEIERNAFGRQTESFISNVDPTKEWDGKDPVEGVFIRAPRIRKVFGKTKVLFTFKEEPVMVQEKNLLASTFHPELTEIDILHKYFLSSCH